MSEPFFKQAYRFFLFSSLYISICAVVMVYQSSRLLHLAVPEWNLLWFVFWSTIASYNFHWFLTPAEYSSSERLSWSARHKLLEMVLCLAGSATCFYYLIFLRPYWGWIGIGVFLTFLYTAPKIPLKPFRFLSKIAVGKTLFLTGVWTYITTILPVAAAGARFTAAALLLTLHRFFLIYAICILFDLRDRDQDKEQGIRSFVTFLSNRGNALLFAGVAAAALAATLCLPWAGFTWPVTGALCLSIGIVCALYPVAKRSTSDYLYYFVLDGLMAFSAAITAFLPH